MANSVEIPDATRMKTLGYPLWLVLLGGVIIVYLILSLWLANTKAPWSDEGQYGNSSYNLAFHGRLATSVVEPSGYFINAYFKGAQDHTYFTVPVQLVALAGWFRVFGGSAFSARLYSICWGAVSLPLLFFILQRLFPDRRVALLAILFTAIDFVYLWSTADARMESAANALTFCSMVAYIYLRERSLLKAAFYSQLFAAAAVFTHPNAALVILAMTLLVWHFDRERVRACGWREWSLAASPYVLFGLAWSLYILQSPGDFKAQFLGNAAGYNGERFSRILHPDVAVLSEISRHIGAYCIGGLWGGVMKNWMLLAPLLYIPALIWLLVNSRRPRDGLYIFTFYTVIMILGMTFLNGFKGYFYLIYVAPLYNTALVLWISDLWRPSLMSKCVASSLGIAFVTLQLSASIVHIHADEYHRDYEPTIRELARDRAEGKSILGTAALGFGLGFTGFSDDARLGTYSGLSPDILVIDRAYRLDASFYDREEPGVFGHIETMLSKRYKFAAQHGSFWIFERNPPKPNAKPEPCLDLGNIDADWNGRRAERLFHLIFARYKMQDSKESSL